MVPDPIRFDSIREPGFRLGLFVNPNAHDPVRSKPSPIPIIGARGKVRALRSSGSRSEKAL